MGRIDWDQVLIDASIAALQGIQETSKIGLVADALPDLLSERAVEIGRSLVSKLKLEIGEETPTEVSEPSQERSETRR